MSLENRIRKISVPYKGDIFMPLAKVEKGGYISIPPQICKKANLKEGSFLKVTIDNGMIIIFTEVMSEDEIRQYWQERIAEEGEVELSEKWQKLLEEGLFDLEHENTVGPFEDIDEAIRVLRSL